jgi:hypothetical protein
VRAFRSRIVSQLPSPPTPANPPLKLLSDAPLESPDDDLFGFRSFADTLAYVIDSERIVTPFTVAISAPWGGGKTSVAQMADRRLKQLTEQRLEEQPNITCWFNAWTHNDAPHLGASLAAAVARTANQRRPWWRRLVAPLPTTLLTPRERWRRRVAVGLITLAVLGFVLMIESVREWLSTLPLMKDSLAGIGTAGVIAVAVVVLWPRVFSAAEQAARFIDNPGSEAARGSMADVKEQIGRLIAEGTRGGRFVLFVDDLERCRPERAVEVCEVVTQLLNQPGVVTVLIADMETIARAARQRYANGERSGEGEDDPQAGREYLEKIVQIQLSLPPPDPEDIRRLLRGGGAARARRP